MAKSIAIWLLICLETSYSFDDIFLEGDLKDDYDKEYAQAAAFTPNPRFTAPKTQSTLPLSFASPKKVDMTRRKPVFTGRKKTTVSKPILTPSAERLKHRFENISSEPVFNEPDKNYNIKKGHDVPDDFSYWKYQKQAQHEPMIAEEYSSPNETDYIEDVVTEGKENSKEESKKGKEKGKKGKEDEDEEIKEEEIEKVEATTPVEVEHLTFDYEESKGKNVDIHNNFEAKKDDMSNRNDVIANDYANTEASTNVDNTNTEASDLGRLTFDYDGKSNGSHDILEDFSYWRAREPANANTQNKGSDAKLRVESFSDQKVNSDVRQDVNSFSEQKEYIRQKVNSSARQKVENSTSRPWSYSEVMARLEPIPEEEKYVEEEDIPGENRRLQEKMDKSHGRPSLRDNQPYPVNDSRFEFNYRFRTYGGAQWLEDYVMFELAWYKRPDTAAVWFWVQARRNVKIILTRGFTVDDYYTFTVMLGYNGVKNWIQGPGGAGIDNPYADRIPPLSNKVKNHFYLWWASTGFFSYGVKLRKSQNDEYFIDANVKDHWFQFSHIGFATIGVRGVFIITNGVNTTTTTTSSTTTFKTVTRLLKQPYRYVPQRFDTNIITKTIQIAATIIAVIVIVLSYKTTSYVLVGLLIGLIVFVVYTVI